ncbi:MAG: CarD family transcriptional regulator, partial [Eggerthellaceae bacterium]
TLEKSGCLDAFWGKLDAGEDGTLGVASSARPFLVAARFAHRPQATLVVVAGEDAAVAFSRSLAAYLGDERVMRFPERSDYPFVPKPSDPAQVARRMEAVHALASGREVVVVASARALVRALPPAGSDVHVPVALSVGRELAAMPGAQAASVTEFEDFAHALEERGYRNTGELDGPGTFAVRGGTIDVFPATSCTRCGWTSRRRAEEIRRIVPTTGQTIQALPDVSIYPWWSSRAQAGLARARQKLERPAQSNAALRGVLEKLDGGLRFDGSDVLLPYLYNKTATLGDYVRPGALTALVEPRSLFDDMAHAHDDVAGRAKGTGLAIQGLYAEPANVSFGDGQRATYVSIMRVGGQIDDELPVKRVEVAGHPDKLYGRLRTLVDTDYTVVFSASNFRARQDMKLAFVDHGLPIQETLDGEEDADELEGIAKRRLRRGVVNVVDVDAPGMIIPKAKLALVSVSDTQGASTARPSRHVDITEITFPYKPGDYVVHAAHGVAHFKELVRRDVDGTARDYLLLEYAEGDKLYVPVEQLDRVTRYVGPEGASPRLTRLNTADWSRALAKARK